MNEMRNGVFIITSVWLLDGVIVREEYLIQLSVKALKK